MKPISIEGANAHPGAPLGWDAEHDGPCGVLPVRVTYDGDRAKTCDSAWVPSPEEIALLISGGSVRLTVAGWQVPVSLHVDPPLPICVLAKDRDSLLLWHSSHGDVHLNHKIECVYAETAETILGRHFSKVIEIRGFEDRRDAVPLREVALSLIRPVQPLADLMANRVEVDEKPTMIHPIGS